MSERRRRRDRGGGGALETVGDAAETGCDLLGCELFGCGASVVALFAIGLGYWWF